MKSGMKHLLPLLFGAALIGGDQGMMRDIPLIVESHPSVAHRKPTNYDGAGRYLNQRQKRKRWRQNPNSKFTKR